MIRVIDSEDQLLIAIDKSRCTLDAGFTTIRELGADVHAVTALRDAIAKTSCRGRRSRANISAHRLGLLRS